MTKTGTYQLNQWESTDKLSRTDFNADNAAIDAALAAKAEKSALTAVETALANYKTANDAAMAKKADASALTAYQTSNDAAVAAKAEQSALASTNTALASVSAKANAAYSASNPSTEFILVSTTGMSAGDTVYTFSKAPRFVLLSGIWTTTVIGTGETITFQDYYIQQSAYDISFQLSGTVLTLVSRGNAGAAKALRMIAFY